MSTFSAIDPVAAGSVVAVEAGAVVEAGVVVAASVVVAAGVVLVAVGSLVVAVEAPSSEHAAAVSASAAPIRAMTDRRGWWRHVSTEVMLRRSAELALKRRRAARRVGRSPAASRLPGVKCVTSASSRIVLCVPPFTALYRCVLLSPDGCSELARHALRRG